jgi:hypothetical protein
LFARDIGAHRSVYSTATMYRMDWTDDRLRERFDSIDQRFDRVDREFRGLRAEMNQRFDALNRTLLQIGGGVIAALIAGFMGLIATQL